MSNVSAILFHGDFDGIISALFLIKAFGLENYKAIPCEPFKLDKIMKHGALAAGAPDIVYMADLAPNNKCIKMTQKFIHDISKFAPRTVIYDHHEGWEHIAIPENAELKLQASAPSCASFIYAETGLSRLGNARYDTLSRDADIIDRGGHSGLSGDGDIVYRALKSDLKDDAVKMAALNYFLGGPDASGLFEALKKKALEYNTIYENSVLAMRSGVEMGRCVYYIDTRGAACDITFMMRECYDRYDFVIVEYPAGGNSFFIIGTGREDADLLKLLDVKSGARFRVTLQKCPKNDINIIAGALVEFSRGKNR